MNLGRAFAELEAGAELYCLHKNRWWQTPRGAAARRRRVRRRARVRDRRRGDGAREAERRVLRGRARGARRRPGAAPGWSATTSRPTSAARRRSACTTSSCAPASSADEGSSDRGRQAGRGSLDSIADLPEWLENNCDERRGRPDRDRRGCGGRSSATRGFRERCFTEAERAYCDSQAEPAAALRGRFAGQGGDRQGARLRRRRASPGRRSRSPAGRSPASTCPAARRRGPSGSARAGSSSR